MSPDIPLTPLPDDVIPDSYPAEKIYHDLTERVTTPEGVVQTEFTKQYWFLEVNFNYKVESECE